MAASYTPSSTLDVGTVFINNRNAEGEEQK
jgi:hypothetical protein